MIEDQEVMAMTDKQLCIEAALLSGWVDVGEGDVIMLSGHPPIDWKPSQDEDQEKNMRYGLPDYLNDIAAAWKLWDTMPCTCGIELYTSSHGLKCGRVYYGEDPLKIFEHLYSWMFNRKEVSPAKVITRTFVLAMRTQQKET